MANQNNKNLKFWVKFLKYPAIIFLAIILGGCFHIFTSSVLGWINPTSQPPPSNNVSKPINIGSTAQTKSGNLTTDSNTNLRIGSGYQFRASGNYIDFGETAQTIRDSGNYIIFSSSTDNNMFNFFTTGGSYDGRFGIRTTDPLATLHVSGTTAVTGTTTISGPFWAGGPANFCRKESCSGSACASSCSAANHYVVAIGGSDDRLINPSTPAAATYRICCKNAD